MTEPRRDHRIRPRKMPRQVRSVETRARILRAAADVFEAHGYDAGTTNRIAEAAALSVGSLYQYFPNKDAILVELLAQHLTAGAGRVREVLVGGSRTHAPLEELVREVVRSLLALHREAPVLHHVLVTRTPLPPDLVAELSALERGLVDELAVVFDALPELALPDPKRAAAMAALAVNGIVHAQVAMEPQLHDDALVDEATAMVVAYLRAAGR